MFNNYSAGLLQDIGISDRMQDRLSMLLNFQGKLFFSSNVQL